MTEGMGGCTVGTSCLLHACMCVPAHTISLWTQVRKQHHSFTDGVEYPRTISSTKSYDEAKMTDYSRQTGGSITANTTEITNQVVGLISESHELVMFPSAKGSFLSDVYLCLKIILKLMCIHTVEMRPLMYKGECYLSRETLPFGPGWDLRSASDRTTLLCISAT